MTFCPPPVQLAAAAPVRAVIHQNSVSHTPAAYESFTGLTSIGFGGIAGERTIASVDYYLEAKYDTQRGSGHGKTADSFIHIEMTARVCLLLC